MRISDWSSDVCSSDLFANVYAIEAMVDDIARGHGIDPAQYRLSMLSDARAIAVIDAVRDMSGWDGRQGGSEDMRSEERRVGKEGVSQCRSRWAPYTYKKKNTSTENSTKNKQKT